MSKEGRINANIPVGKDTPSPVPQDRQRAAQIVHRTQDSETKTRSVIILPEPLLNKQRRRLDDRLSGNTADDTMSEKGKKNAMLFSLFFSFLFFMTTTHTSSHTMKASTEKREKKKKENEMEPPC